MSITINEYKEFVRKCVGEEDLEAVKKIINESNVNSIPDGTNFLTPIATAIVEAGNVEIVEYLLSQGAEPNQSLPKERGGSNLLQIAIGDSLDSYKDGFTKVIDISILKLLIKYGSDINKIDNNGNTPLSYSIISKNHKAEEYLRSLGAKTSEELEQENK